MWVLKWLGLSSREKASAQPESPALRKILAAVDSMAAQSPAEARYLASFAYLLSRVAYADGEISAVEVQRMKQLLRHHAKLSLAQAGIVVDLAKMENVMGTSGDGASVSAEFVALASPAQQASLLDALFAVAAADEIIYPVEASEIMTIGEEMGLPKGQLMAIRSRYLKFIPAQELRPS